MATNVTGLDERIAVSFEEAERLVPFSAHTLREWERQGRLKATRCGRRVIISMDEIRRIATEGIGPVKAADLPEGTKESLARGGDGGG